MKNATLLLAMLLVPLGSTGMTDAKEASLTPAPTIPDRILAEALRSGSTHALLADLCATAPRRLAGSEGAAQAVAWAVRAMKAAGLENVRLEPCSVPYWERGEVAVLRIAGEPADAGPVGLAILAIGGSVPTPPDGLTADVLEVGSIDELRGKAAAAKGRIVFFNRPMDATLADTFAAYGGAVDQRVDGAVEAARVGAVAVVVRSLTTRIDDVPHTGTLRYAEGVGRIPAVAVSTRDANRLSRLLSGSSTAVSLHLRLDCRWHEDAPSHNVLGELRGREKPDEIVVVGGHLDSWDVGEGAHDDGAGCCQSIAAAALLGRLDLRPRRTIRVVLFMNEENGSRGARAYAMAHAGEMERHVMALESDRGGFTPRGFVTNAGPEALAVLRSLSAPLDAMGIGWVRSGGAGADVAPMGRSGVVLVGYVPDSQRYFDVHHSASDTLESVNPRELELGTAAIAALLHAVADREDPLPRNEPSDD